jgi:shikimate dehydrogenase
MSGINGDTAIYWMIGEPIQQVKSPGLMNAYFVEHALNAALIPVHVPPEQLLQALVLFAHANNVRGLLTTLPHKAALANHVQAASERAQQLGVVNTVRKQDGALVGDIFDGIAVLSALRAQSLQWQGLNVAIVGCGGIGRASAWELLAHGAEQVQLIDSDSQRAHDLSRWLCHRFGSGRAVSVAAPGGNVQIALNASPLGMKPDDPLPLNLTQLPHLSVVIDAVTGGPTRWLGVASRLGVATVNGDAIAQAQMMEILSFWDVALPIAQD